MFEGRLALVTGGSRGIGRAIALELGRRGADVVVNYVRNEPAAEAVVAELREMGRRAVAVRANVGDRKQLNRLAEATLEHGNGQLDLLIHNAALGVFKPTLAVRANQFRLSMAVSVEALLELVKLVRPGLQSGSSIVALSSRGAQRVLSDYGAVGVAKAALESLARYLAMELAPRGIRVNVITAGMIETDAVRALPDAAARLAEAAAQTPLGRRVGRPEDVAVATAMLCGPDARFITGQVLVVDGGHSLAYSSRS